MIKIASYGNNRIIGVRDFSGKDRMINYYICTPTNQKLYAFTREYTNSTYGLVKSGIRIDELLKKKTPDRGVMNLVNYIRRVMPYLADEYELDVVA